MRKTIDLTGRRFNYLTVIGRAQENSKDGYVRWICKCDCGNKCVVRADHLKSGNTKSCGCNKSQKIDLTGQRFGHLTVIEMAGKTNDRKPKPLWRCVCDCGNETIVRGNNLKTGNVKSCGCVNGIKMIGRKFGHLTVSERAENDKNNKVVWKCVCDCGKECVVLGTSLRKGNTRSCGCGNYRKIAEYQPKEEPIDKRIIRIWGSMYTRCYNKTHRSYKNYGARGIKICDEWIGENGCRHFYEWAIKNGYANNLTIDRIDNDGNYEPNNCRWVDYTEQNNNRRSCISLLYNGKEVTIKELSKIIRVSTAVIYNVHKKEGRVDFTDWASEHKRGQ